MTICSKTAGKTVTLSPSPFFPVKYFVNIIITHHDITFYISDLYADKSKAQTRIARETNPKISVQWSTLSAMDWILLRPHVFLCHSRYFIRYISPPHFHAIYIYSMLAQCWASVVDGGPTLCQHWLMYRVCVVVTKQDKKSTNVVLMSGHRLRRWPSMNQHWVSVLSVLGNLMASTGSAENKNDACSLIHCG